MLLFGVRVSRQFFVNQHFSELGSISVITEKKNRIVSDLYGGLERDKGEEIEEAGEKEIKKC
jgi:hypothetical protein